MCSSSDGSALKPTRIRPKQNVPLETVRFDSDSCLQTRERGLKGNLTSCLRKKRQAVRSKTLEEKEQREDIG